MSQDKWIPVQSGADEGTPSRKRVSSSGIQAVRVRAVDAPARGSTRVTYSVGGAWQGTLEHAGTTYDTIMVPEAASTADQGAPAIPAEGIFVAVPRDATNVDARVTRKMMEPLDGEWKLNPAPRPITEEEYLQGLEEYTPNPEFYDSDDKYPGEDLEFLGAKVLDGVQVAHILVYLAQYRPLSGSLALVKSMTIEVSYDIPPQTDRAPVERALRPMFSDMILDFESVEEEWDQGAGSDAPSDASTAPDDAGETRGDGLTDPPGAIVAPLVPVGPVVPVTPVIPETPVVPIPVAQLKIKSIVCEYVIITPAALETAVEPLLNVKRGWPHYARVATTETISSEFNAPSIRQSIKAFLAWAWDNWRCPPRYVVLAGDTDTIPVHMWTIGDNTYASDHYYADINGNLAPEIVVSRIPTSDEDTMLEVCQKLARYADLRGPDWAGWPNEVILVAYEASVYKDCSDDIASSISPRFSVTKRYGDSSSKQQVVDTMNNGVLIANYRGHGSKTSWSSHNGLQAQDVRDLTNDNKPPLVFCIACQNAWVDAVNSEVFVETFLREGKTVAILGASRNSPTYANNDLDKYLFRAVMDHGEVSPGRIFLRAKTMMVMNHATSTSHMQDVVMYMLFGDPTAKVASTVEFLRGAWDMDHDGWKGVLEINRIWRHRVERSGPCGYPVWDFSGTYSRAGKKKNVQGKIGGRDKNNKNAGCKRTDYQIVFTIGFAPNNQQRFEGYVTTWTRNVMAGYTWWAGRPFGWYAKKR